MRTPYFIDNGFSLYHGDCVDIMKDIRDVDMIFADPPYFLSNGGYTVKNGKIVSVNKATWDILTENIDSFNFRWLQIARVALKPNGSIWVSGTVHNIYSVVRALTVLNFKILNSITWQKRNPPPNFSCRTFAHSTETIIWARKEAKVPHYYNYDLMKAFNDGKQMKDVWALKTVEKWEKTCGNHPTQKPLSLLSRIILASTHKGDLILDPFCGSSTTGIAALLFGRNYIGIDTEKDYLELSIKRYSHAVSNRSIYIEKIENIPPQYLELDK